MAVQAITFFKVPFDNTYKNVYAFPETNSPSSQYIYNKFRETFDYLDYPITNKEFRITNNRMVISYYTVSRNGAAYYNINQYNYCAVQSNTTGTSEWRFYFVTGYSTLNQSPTNGSIDLQVEYDCWINNVFEIIQSKKYSAPHKFIASKGHINDVIKQSGNVYSKQLAFTADNLIYTFEHVNSSRKNKILWARILLTTNELYQSTDSGFVKKTVYSCSSGNVQLPYVYLPVAVYNSISKEYYPSATYKLQTKDETTSLIIPIGCFNMKFNTTGIISTVDFTFYPPFNIYEDETNKRFVIDADQNVYQYTWYSKVNDEYQSIAYTAYSDNIERTQVVSARSQYFAPKLIYNTDKIYISHSTENDYILGVSNPLLAQYPFEYYDIEISGTHTQLVLPENCTSFQIVIKIINESVMWYAECFDKNDNEIYQTRELPIYNNGIVPHISDPESLFYRNQGNQFKTQIDNANTKFMSSSVQNAISGVTSAAMFATGLNGNIGGVVNAINGEIQAGTEYYMQNKMFAAKRADLANQTNEISIGSANALESIFLQNALIITKYTAVNSTERDNLLYDIYRYGLQINHTDYSSNLSHKVFNYKKAVDFQIPTITSNQERFTIERIFNSGVTIWNFPVSTDTDAERTAKISMEPNDVPNPCI